MWKKKVILCLGACVALMLLLPWLAVTFVKGDAGMAACFLLFYAINPIYFVAIGVIASKDTKRLWGLPAIAAVLFMSGTWLLFDMGETAFILYAAVYLVLAMAAMLVSRCVAARKQKDWKRQ